MTTYSYIARDRAGQQVTGRLAGPTEQAILSELAARELAPIRVSAIRESQGLQRGVSVRHLATAYRQLADLLRAGVPLLRGLRLLGRAKSSPRLARVMRDVADRVADGERLGDAMNMHSDVFPDVQIAMVRAGERGGFLEDVLARMGTFLEHQADLRGRVVGNLIYPFMLLLIGLSIIIVALVVFVPRFETFYAQLDLPWPTRVLLFASNLMTERGWILLIVGGLLAFGIWSAWHRPDVRRPIAVLVLRVPHLGALTRALAIGRFCRVLGTLLTNGIPMLSAMQISRDAAGHILLREAIDDATEAVRAGETLVRPLADSGLFGDDVIEMITVGESANNLADVLLTVAETIEKRVDRLLAVFLRLMEPILLLMLAGAVLFIFIALIVPMMQMSAAI